MTDLYPFLSGIAWVITGMGVLGWIDPDGNHDDLLMGPAAGSLFQMGVMLAIWPVTGLVMLHRKRR